MLFKRNKLYTTKPNQEIITYITKYKYHQKIGLNYNINKWLKTKTSKKKL